MKILRIFGIVVSVHFAALMIVVVVPGCSSKTRRAPTPAETKSASAEPAVSYPGSTSGGADSGSLGAPSAAISNSDLNPAVASASSDSPISPVQPASGSPVRLFNPTRPNTPTASALQNAPVTDVQQVTTYTVAAGDSLWTVSRKHSMTVAELAVANNLKTDAILGVGKKLVIPAKMPAVGAGGPGIGGDTIIYTVKAGDSLAMIAKRSGTTVGAIRTLNKLKGDIVRVGQQLILPASTDTAATLATTAMSAPSRSSKANVDGVKHIVKPGETLGQIARKYGVSQREIGAANHISDPQKLPLGKELIIPGATKPETPAPAAPATEPAAMPASPVAPVSEPASPVGAPDASPISAPAAVEPPVVRIEEASPVSSSR